MTSRLPVNHPHVQKRLNEFCVRLCIHCPRSKSLGFNEGKDKSETCDEFAPCYWRHTRCGGAAYIDEDGDVRCNCPGTQGVLFGLSFRCGERHEEIGKFNALDAVAGLSLAWGSLLNNLNNG